MSTGTAFLRRCFSIHDVVFEILAPRREYLHLLPSDVVGEETDVVAPDVIHGRIYLLDVPGDNSSAASERSLFIAADFGPRQSQVKARFGVGLASKFVIRRMEDLGVFHVHGSAVVAINSNVAIALLGGRGRGKSLAALLLCRDSKIKPITNTFLAFREASSSIVFHRGSKTWLIRPEVLQTHPGFLEGKTPVFSLTLPTDEEFLGFDVADSYVDQTTVAPRKYFLVWPRLGPEDSSQPIGRDQASDLLLADLDAFLSASPAKWGIDPSLSWIPRSNPGRKDALEQLVRAAAGCRAVTGSPEYVAGQLEALLID